ncbi:hypothetical protein GA0074695_1531 [Micromonospora viridifaciens]|uniref:Uncharacterized protein n=1 Tax=Micromonospora viridifaciens TaxID=1881 RepID=A0A1C4VK24_MICVI|nr:hypothetical protein [Micromonospora viridifaciens]SCE84155.1 hypothetical protein GA0074695_1531 [Micromonospora viridifaciens]
MTDPAPLPGLPRPLLTPSGDGTPGHAPALTTGRDSQNYAPPFDPAEVAAKMPPRPATGSGHIPGEFREPAEPFAPPAWADVPADLAEALAEYDAKRAAWSAAVDDVDEYRESARLSRAQREAAVQAAGRAAARGAKRPAIPSAITEADEETEVRVLSAVVATRQTEADAAARKADRLAMTYAADWAAEAVERFGPALGEASAAVQAAYEAAQRAESVLSQSAHWRSLALAADLGRAGVRVTEHQRARILSDLLDASKPWQYSTAEAQRRNPTDLLNRVHEALGTLRMCDPGVIPAADTLYLPGGDEVYRVVWRAIFDNATEERKQRFRDRHAGGYPLHHERER